MMTMAAERSYYDMPGSGMFIPHIHDYNQNVTIHLPANRKTKSTSSGTSYLRKFFFSVKGRRKEKDSTAPPTTEYKLYLEEDYVKEKVIDSDLDRLVTLPTGLDYNEWLATHTISFFEHVNLMYGSVSEYCTSTGCPGMIAPANTEYMWPDDKGKKVCRCPAPQYVDYVMSIAEKAIQDDTVFPTKYGHVFPSTFENTVKKIHRHLFHVIAHIYQSHFKEIVCLQLQAHLNTVFQHFMTFSRKFNTLDRESAELCILDDLYEKLVGVRPGCPQGDENGENKDTEVKDGKEDSKESSTSKEDNKENENQDIEPKKL